eukprot:1009488-Ditylum_brightwellii.AAC.1
MVKQLTDYLYWHAKALNTVTCVAAVLNRGKKDIVTTREGGDVQCYVMTTPALLSTDPALT